MANSDAMSRDDARDARRLKVFQVAKLGTASSVVRCHVLNLSKGGALIDCRDKPLLDAELKLTTDVFEREAEIRWHDGPRIGIRFHLPLNDGQLSAALKPSSAK